MGEASGGVPHRPRPHEQPVVPHPGSIWRSTVRCSPSESRQGGLLVRGLPAERHGGEYVSLMIVVTGASTLKFGRSGLPDRQMPQSEFLEL